MQKQNDILSSDNALWEKVFLAANKDTPMIEDGSNYGDFLLKTIDGAKDEFAADELKTLKPVRSRSRRSRTSSRAWKRSFLAVEARRARESATLRALA